MTTTDNTKSPKPGLHVFLEGPEGNRYAGSAYRTKKVPASLLSVLNYLLLLRVLIERS
jgi:hypothetical protein